jgi:hypothetical protein
LPSAPSRAYRAPSRSSRASSRGNALPKWFANSQTELPSFLENIQRITAYTHREIASQSVITDILTHVDSISQSILSVVNDATALFKRKLVIWMIGLVKGYVDVITTRISSGY